MVIATAIAIRPYGALTRGYLIATFVVGLILTVGPSLIGGEWQDLSLTFGSHTAVFLTMFAAICVILANESQLARRTITIT